MPTVPSPSPSPFPSPSPGPFTKTIDGVTYVITTAYCASFGACAAQLRTSAVWGSWQLGVAIGNAIKSELGSYTYPTIGFYGISPVFPYSQSTWDDYVTAYNAAFYVPGQGYGKATVSTLGNSPGVTYGFVQIYSPPSPSPSPSPLLLPSPSPSLSPSPSPLPSPSPSPRPSPPPSPSPSHYLVGPIVRTIGGTSYSITTLFCATFDACAAQLQAAPTWNNMALARAVAGTVRDALGTGFRSFPAGDNGPAVAFQDAGGGWYVYAFWTRQTNTDDWVSGLKSEPMTFALVGAAAPAATEPSPSASPVASPSPSPPLLPCERTQSGMGWDGQGSSHYQHDKRSLVPPSRGGRGGTRAE